MRQIYTSRQAIGAYPETRKMRDKTIDTRWRSLFRVEIGLPLKDHRPDIGYEYALASIQQVLHAINFTFDVKKQSKNGSDKIEFHRRAQGFNYPASLGDISVCIRIPVQSARTYINHCQEPPITAFSVTSTDKGKYSQARRCQPLMKDWSWGNYINIGCFLPPARIFLFSRYTWSIGQFDAQHFHQSSLIMSTYSDTPKVMNAFNETADHGLPLNITPNIAYLPRYKKADRVSNKTKAEVVETSTAPATLVQDDAGSIVYYLDFDANFQELATTRLMIF